VLAAALTFLWCGAGALEHIHFAHTIHCPTGNGELIHAAHHDHAGVSSSDGSASVCEHSCPACHGGLHRCGAGHYLNPRAAWTPSARPSSGVLSWAAPLFSSDPSFLLPEERLYLLRPKHSPPSPR
jgi:hypothetical protein